jgi:hypothetical protein
MVTWNYAEPNETYVKVTGALVEHFEHEDGVILFPEGLFVPLNLYNNIMGNLSAQILSIAKNIVADQNLCKVSVNS